MSLDIYDFYKQLDLATLTFLETKLQPIALSHNQILFYQGDICEHILFLTKGNVRLFIQSQEGDEIILYQLNEGEQCIVNTASGLGNIEAIATAITTTDIEGYLLKIEHVKKLASISDAYQNFLFST